MRYNQQATPPQLEPTKVVEFCRGKRCCPTITKDGDTIFIGEDNNVVKLTIQQFKDLQIKLSSPTILQELGVD